MRNIKVRLEADLTRYNPGLLVGIEGVAGGCSPLSDRFTKAIFPGLGTFDVLWQSLKIVDEEYLKEKAEEKKALMKCLEKATNVVEIVGPRGGFKSLSYECVVDGVFRHTCDGGKQSADELKEFFRKQGIPVRVEIQK